jgi:hypothetical protein
VNHKWALKGAALYEGRGAIVAFETYDEDFLVHSPLLRDWIRTYVVGGKGDSIAEKAAKAKQLVSRKPSEIDSTAIIKEQAAKKLGKPTWQLTKADLAGMKELSLMGRHISDVSYLVNMTNLETLDISFTYVGDLKPLLNCRDLRQLDISDVYTKDLSDLKQLTKLERPRMWNLWLDRDQVDDLKRALPNLSIVDYQWDIYEKDSIDRVLPKLRVELKSEKTRSLAR